MMKKFRNIITKIVLAGAVLIALNSKNAEAQNLQKITNNNAVALTPPMGWNSWNWFGKKEVNETVVREVIDAMAANGLRDAGYNYIIVDGGWRDTKLGPDGEQLVTTKRFPHGIKVLIDYAHSKGFKFGVHTVPGTHDCGGDPVGGYGHEEVQVQQLIDWGIDFIKLDKCKFSSGWNEELLKKTYEKWSDLIKKSGKPIVLEISAYTFREWNPEVGNMSRTTPDISAKVQGSAFFDSIPQIKNFWSVMHVAEENNKFAAYARPGYWNHAEMLVTGDQGLTPEEQKMHFALWNIMSAPLFLGDDPRHLPQYEKDIILNKDAISIDQDPTEQGVQMMVNDSTEVWAKKLQNGKAAVLFLNRSHTSAKNISFDLAKIGLEGKVKIKDVYAKKKTGKAKITLSKTLQPRTCLYMLLSK